MRTAQWPVILEQVQYTLDDFFGAVLYTRFIKEGV